MKHRNLKIKLNLFTLTSQKSDQRASIENQLAEKKTSITLNLNEDPSAILSYYLRAYCGRSDLTKLNQSLSIGNGPSNNHLQSLIVNEIENLRTDIAIGDLKTAYCRIRNFEDTHSVGAVENKAILGDWNIEKLRIALWRSDLFDLDNVLGGLKPLECFLNPTSFVTANQLIGQHYFLKGDWQESKVALERALKGAAVFGFTELQSAFSARAFLTIVLAHLQMTQESTYHFFQLQKDLATLKNKTEIFLDRLQIFLRTEFHLNRLGNKTAQAISNLREAWALSEYLGETLVVQKCISDYESLTKASSLAEDLGEPVEPDEKDALFPVVAFNQCFVLSRFQLVLFPRIRLFCNLERHPRLYEIFEKVSKGPESGLQPHLLFETIWKQRYSEQSHGALIRNMLSKLRKLLPNDSLKTKNGLIQYSFQSLFIGLSPSSLKSPSTGAAEG